MVSKATWVFLVYQLPREPSTPRIAVWRRLRRLGVAQLSDGLVAIPHDAATKEQLEWVAHLVTEAGGTASIWIATPTIQRFGRNLMELIAADRSAEYRKLASQANEAAGSVDTDRRRTLRRLRAELRRIERRDHFPPPEKQEALSAIEALSDSLPSAR